MIVPKESQYMACDKGRKDSTTMRRLFAMFILMGLCLFQPISFAIGGDEGNLTWSISDNGQLTISGRGKISDYTDRVAPWGQYHEQINTIVIEEGITSVGDGAFTGCENVFSVSFPNSLKAINWRAFQGCQSLLIVKLPKGLSSKKAPIEARRLSVKTGKKRGTSTRTVRIPDNGISFDGIVDYKHHNMLWPQEGIEIYAVNDQDQRYYGGKNTGVYWIYSNNLDRYAFWDIPSGYFSGYLFHESQDLIFDDPNTGFLRVTENGHQFYYINRRNGDRLSPLYFSGINTSGLYKGYAIETIYGTKEDVVINEKGQIYHIPVGFTPVYDRIEKGILYLESNDGTMKKIRMNKSLAWEDTN